MADKMATRQAYGKTLIKLGEQYPDLVVMDADLSKSSTDCGDSRQDIP